MSPKTVNSIDSYVAARLRACRKQLGMSQAQIAKQLGVTFQQIQKYEAGLNRIGAGRLFQFANLYGVSLQELFPKDAGTPEGAERTEKQDRITSFALSSDGWKLCDSYLRIENAAQRRSVLALLEEMAAP